MESATPLLFGAGLLAGAMNALAGGGSFVTLPALMFAGVPSVSANASSTVALLPGAATSAWAYRRDYRGFEQVSMRAMVAVSLTGGLAGALLLLFTPSRAFDFIVPWLLLVGSLAFAFGRQAGAWLRRRMRIGRPALLLAQGALAVYGGYFGGAVGIMMMAVWSLLGHDDLRALNASRTLLVGATNVVAVLCFAAAKLVWWPQTLVMLAAAALGGYLGAHGARRLPVPVVRLLISAFGFSMTALLFWRAWSHA
ncbi:sulfite exporter TauE/SafE family protein [Ralstonia pseudosolanacearum]|uniref:sulfite exporter TauE/SafE family protein n=1 Tax=Ralstonia solanacearum species complex TaxID=3116862 RepID=UPI0002ED7F4E|nr:sulfite exporter TauE/SafE family protein [Ralstonia pseudosolanacearum]MCK4122162.1 sulfite exporter TauE/SafE family protein [Ralstonia pseudosolanacearum]